ncbi:hypothetical protein BDY19DRAFT_359633 [Irpex rosettiformis]|uniref:Uncharacterized protein n=1 Tax=Irpex rosettiformis TaxID=378272 RepID=A0ACB8TWE3_9APHY|nr:hypothetical protein BDY19DRAFT_359633 [Irpex rosettiformis]
MTRQHTALNQRVGQGHGLGLGLSPAKRIRPTRTLPQHRSPLNLKLQAKRGTSRLLSRKIPALPTILEEEEEGDEDAQVFGSKRQDRDRVTSSSSWNSKGKALSLLAGIEEESEDGMDWDDETTLISLLQDDRRNDDDEEEDVNALVEKLRSPMNAQSQELKRYMVDNILPAVQRVKEVHEALEDEVDLAYGTGLLAFDEVCKRVETLALHTEDETRTGYLDTQKEVKTLMAQLTEAYRHRDSLWTDLDENLEKCAQRARRAVENIPGAVEDTITKLEKKSKDMEKNVGSQANKQKMLQDLLSRL